MPFGEIIILDEHTHELIPYEGEVSKQDVDEYIAFWKPRNILFFKVLLYKLNSYSYSFLAQQRLQTIKVKPVIAILNATKASRVAFESMEVLTNDWVYSFFESRKEALAWLDSYNA